MKMKVKKLRVDERKLTQLPIFYNHIIYNELITLEDPFYRVTFNKKMGSYIQYAVPNKPVSKIIDFSKFQ
ncbi:hypothetical protein [Chitinophaga nivalis]|uniref:Uncharacterized protein n=1 Tax=Chitinophaga nivalis TaxID=2991709 RepID=A0ABT3IKL8_9BACT|nr:hypothetical protein [Chitinophaga nivalis]MCW3465789.1 hypothetical protein [Chitinophaga nivalis]MCW3484520.1 hypothetical protein [Chitinophaga nivalis]